MNNLVTGYKYDHPSIFSSKYFLSHANVQQANNQVILIENGSYIHIANNFAAEKGIKAQRQINFTTFRHAIRKIMGLYRDPCCVSPLICSEPNGRFVNNFYKSHAIGRHFNDIFKNLHRSNAIGRHFNDKFFFKSVHGMVRT